MRPDEDMIREAELSVTRGKARDAMADRIANYRIACLLATGASAARSRYWQEKAARLANEIKRLTPCGTAPGVGREQCA